MMYNPLVGKGFWDDWAQPMTEHQRVDWTMALRATSCLSLNTSMDSERTDAYRDSPGTQTKES